jgi:hypothetical protein
MESPTILFFMVCFVVLFLIVGIIAGWFVNDIVYNFYNKNNSLQLHPEMYDEDGIVINEELLSVRFIQEEEEEEEEDDPY